MPSIKQQEEIELMKKIGDKIRILRLTQRKTQDNMSKSLGVGACQVGKYERGENRISVKRLVDIASFLEISVEELLPIQEKDLARLI